MYQAQEDARSDFVLAAAPALIYPLVASLLDRVLGALGSTRILAAALLFLFTGFMPLWLARYRSQGLAAFGLDGPRGGLSAGLPLAAVFLGLSMVYGLASGELLRGTLGDLQRLTSLPSVDSGYGLLDAVGDIAFVTAEAAGTVLLTTFLTTRARHAFREIDMPRVEALRTYGMIAAGVLVVLGLLVSLGSARLVDAVGPGVGVAAIVLLTDRLVQPNTTSSRWALVAPGLVLVFVQVGIFGLLTNPVGTLLVGGVVFATALVASVLVETRRYAWGAVPMLIASVVWPLLQL